MTPKFHYRLSVHLVVLVCVVCGCKSEELSTLNPQRNPHKRTGLFFSIQGYAANLIFKTLQVTDVFGCASACLKEPCCQSFNFGTSGNPKHLCELSRATLGEDPRPGFIYYFAVKSDPCRSSPCKNGARCAPVPCEEGYRCICGAFNTGKHCQLWTVNVSSCQDIYNKTSYRADTAYTYVIDDKPTDIYCHLSSNLCGSKGWTLVLKTDGSKQTFNYSSSLWSSKNSHEESAGQTGFDNHETKMPSYWAMPFQSLCVGMKVGNNLTWALIPYTAPSLYDVIADGKNRSFSIGRNQWLSIIGWSSMQANCNSEGFNVGVVGSSGWSCARIGIVANQENDCNSPDSVIGYGVSANAGITCGNRCRIQCSNGEKDIAAFGYILIK